jgi:hypothetical protein
VRRGFEERDLVFYSEFLSLQVVDHVRIGEWTADFLVDLFLEATMAAPQSLDPIAKQHGSSCLDRARQGMLTPIGGGGQVRYAPPLLANKLGNQ